MRDVLLKHFDPVLDMEVLQKAMHISPDSGGIQVKLKGNLLVGVSLENGRKDLLLSRRGHRPNVRRAASSTHHGARQRIYSVLACIS